MAVDDEDSTVFEPLELPSVSDEVLLVVTGVGRSARVSRFKAVGDCGALVPAVLPDISVVFDPPDVLDVVPVVLPPLTPVFV
ncbi:hypothetical protein [Mycobacterium sp. NS-7484]|uniref:hypothetical protein n=1 Tax=Mycobacterium sp. NS-7484 TaxID=1834161 RepID=UPI00114EE54B|nr:hypothetical protein [Mycobacterium sp. NS-7484]